MAKVQVGVSSPAAIKAAKVKAPKSTKATGVLGGGFAKSPGKVNKAAMAVLNNPTTNNPLLSSTVNAPSGNHASAAVKAGEKAFGGLPKPMGSKALKAATNRVKRLEYLATTKPGQPSNALKLQAKNAQEGSVGKVLSTAAKQVAGLPVTTGLGIAATTGNLASAVTGHPQGLINEGKSIATQDPIVQTIEHGNPKYMAANPLGTALDVIPVAGAVGKLAKAGDAADALDRAVVPGTKIARKTTGVEKLEGLGPGGKQIAKLAHAGSHPVHTAYSLLMNRELPDRDVDAMLRRVHEHNAVSQHTLHESEAQLAKALKAVSPKSAEAKALVGHLRLGAPEKFEDAMNQLKDLHDNFSQALDTHHVATRAKDALKDGDLEPAKQLLDTESENKKLLSKQLDNLRMSDTDLRANEANRTTINQILRNPEHYESAFNAAKVHSALGHALDEKQAFYELRPQSMLERRELEPYAINRMNATVLSKEDKIPTERSLDAKDAQRNADEAQAELKSAQAGMHDDLVSLRRKQMAEEGSIQSKLNKAKTEATQKRLKNTLTTLQKTHSAEFNQAQRGLVAEQKEVYSGLRKQANASKPFLKEKKTGLHIPGANPGEYEPLSNADIREHMQQNGVNPENVGYLNMRQVPGSDEQAVSQLGRTTLGRGGSTGSKFTGGTLARGTYAGDEAASINSLLRSNSAVNKAAGWDRFIKDFTVKTFDPDDKVDLQDYITRYNEANPHLGGLTPVYTHPSRVDTSGAAIADLNNLTPGERVALVPTRAVQELRNFKGQGYAKGFSEAQNVFRASVLTLSPNYYMSVLQEGMFRAAANRVLPRTAAAKSFMAELKSKATDLSLPKATRAEYQDAYERYETLTSTGTNVSQHLNALHKELTAKDINPTKVAAAAKKVLAIYKKPMQLARKMENFQNMATLDSHLRREAGNILTSNKKMESVMEDLAAGHIDSNSIHAAMEYNEKVLGRYNVMSPQEQKAIRNVVPFWRWASNATHFVFTMPRDHPVQQALLYNIGHAYAQAHQQEDKALQEYTTSFMGQQWGNIPMMAHTPIGQVDVLRNTPYGVAENSPLETLGTSLFPQAQGIAAGLVGDNSFWEPQETSTYGKSVPAFSGTALGLAAKQGATGIGPYNFVANTVKGITGGTSKHAALSHEPYLRAIENTLGGSLRPYNYTGTEGSSSSSSSSKGFGSSSGFSGGGFSSGGFSGGGF